MTPDSIETIEHEFAASHKRSMERRNQPRPRKSWAWWLSLVIVLLFVVAMIVGVLYSVGVIFDPTD